MKINGWQKRLIYSKGRLSETETTPSRSNYLVKSDNNTKVKYYTGLPTFTTLMAIFTFDSTSVEDNHVQ